MKPVVVALLVCFGPAAGWAQDAACTQRCSESMGSCMSGCRVGDKCGTLCGRKVNECLSRCIASKPMKPKKERQCVGADGRRIQCFDFKKPPPPKAIPTEPEEK